MENPWKQKIFNVDRTNFENLALEIFSYQAKENKIYAAYLDSLNRAPSSITQISDIPFMPIEFFKFHNVVCGTKEAELVFSSSTTTSDKPSLHYVADSAIYKESARKGFESFYGSIEDYEILSLLPSYLEREGSSLVHMVSQWNLMKGLDANAGFYLYDHEALKNHLERNESAEKKTLLIGVSFALLDFAENNMLDLEHTIVMETGGMKGRRKEITRSELHKILKTSLGVEAIHSEYGMTELLSQAYSSGEGIFECPSWMKVIGRELNDPFSPAEIGSSAALNIIDLGNVHSCSFISTSDIGRVYRDARFEVLGRMDVSDTRGCNLMVD